ncbi:MAG: undecaprenyl/decaprenyl-phosphate alpha-N-acetylglucosaminyl 1-phosphate transferase, partial [Alphaproteobacteria bacterium]
AAFASGLLVISRVVRFARGREQNRQKCFHQTHQNTVPRIGGLGIAVAYLVGGTVFFLGRPEFFNLEVAVTLVLGPMLMFGVGFWDDLRPLGARVKLLMQIAVATLIAVNGLAIESVTNPFNGVSVQIGLWGVVASVVWIVVLTNLINIIDGIDGLAGGISLMLMILLINVCAGSGRYLPALLALVTAGALLAFLYFNFPPAKIYMGDGGAYFLGCLIGVLTIYSSQKGTVAAALVAPIFALGLPIIDVALTLIRRALKGLPIFRADRRHLHHRLVDKGYSHRRSVLTLYVLSLICLLMALAVFSSKGQLVPLFSGVLFVGVIFLVHSFGFVPEKYSLKHLWDELSDVRRESRYIITLGRWLELEAERCETPEELWENFQFLAQKLNLFQVRLAVEEGELIWRNSSSYGRTPSELVTRHVPIHSGSIHGLDIVCEREGNPEKVFELKAELVTEAWVKAANRWSQHRRQEVRFASDSLEDKRVDDSAIVPPLPDASH